MNIFIGILTAVCIIGFAVVMGYVLVVKLIVPFIRSLL